MKTQHSLIRKDLPANPYCDSHPFWRYNKKVAKIQKYRSLARHALSYRFEVFEYLELQGEIRGDKFVAYNKHWIDPYKELGSFTINLKSGAWEDTDEQNAHGEDLISLVAYISTTVIGSAADDLRDLFDNLDFDDVIPNDGPAGSYADPLLLRAHRSLAEDYIEHWMNAHADIHGIDFDLEEGAKRNLVKGYARVNRISEDEAIKQIFFTLQHQMRLDDSCDQMAKLKMYGLTTQKAATEKLKVPA